MKNRNILIVGLCLLIGSITTYGNDRKSKNPSSETIPQEEKTITVQCTPDLEAVTNTWALEYGKLNPGVHVEVIQMPKSLQPADLREGADLSFISGDYIETVGKEKLWYMIVGSDAIVPIISAKNPFLKKISKRGITSEELAALFTQSGNRTWGNLAGNGLAVPVHYYRLSDDAVQSQAANFLHTDPSLLTGIDVATASELISSLQGDPYGIGFCRLMDLVDPGNQKLVKQIALLPIDKNRNGSLDRFENIYGNLTEFSRGVWIGKYPKVLSRTIYSVSPEKPTNKAELAFLTWVVTGGQQLLTPLENSGLTYSSRVASRVELLAAAPAAEMISTTGLLNSKAQGLSIFSFVIILLIPVVLVFMVGNAVRRHRRQKQAELAKSMKLTPVLLTENSIKAPDGLYYDKSHTWAFMEKDGVVRVGMDDFLQHITGPLTRIKMKGTGERVKKGDALFSIIQNGKQLTIHAPISGTIMAKNNQLNTDTSMLNASPYTDGWIYMIEPTNWVKEIRFLFMGYIYKDWML
ncbi:MAG: hypothetical protein IH596_09740 [Bacteroidales bacterium]|nr:hypothetical protein [Bacteroidales bacterium]